MRGAFWFNGGMDARQISLVQSSFAQLERDAAPLADLLYARLFQLDPPLRGLFPNELRDDKDKFLSMLTFVVKHLERPEEWQTCVERLGSQHRAYGVEPRHYQALGSALIWTLDKAMGEEFGFELLGAWVAFYTLLAQTMQSENPSNPIRRQNKALSKTKPGQNGRLFRIVS